MEVRKVLIEECDGWKLHELWSAYYPEDSETEARLHLDYLELTIPDGAFKHSNAYYWEKVMIVGYRTGVKPYKNTINTIINNEFCPQSIKNVIYLYTL